MFLLTYPGSLQDAVEQDLSSKNEVDLDTGCSVHMHEGEQVLDGQSASMASQAMSTECMELCCSAGGPEISQPTNPLTLKKTERCFGSGKNAHN